jgi:hypothetical protein
MQCLRCQDLKCQVMVFKLAGQAKAICHIQCTLVMGTVMEQSLASDILIQDSTKDKDTAKDKATDQTKEVQYTAQRRIRMET